MCSNYLCIYVCVCVCLKESVSKKRRTAKTLTLDTETVKYAKKKDFNNTDVNTPNVSSMHPNKNVSGGRLTFAEISRTFTSSSRICIIFSNSNVFFFFVSLCFVSE